MRVLDGGRRKGGAQDNNPKDGVSIIRIASTRVERTRKETRQARWDARQTVVHPSAKVPSSFEDNRHTVDDEGNG